MQAWPPQSLHLNVTKGVLDHFDRRKGRQHPEKYY